jgi:LuxR family maltose regulon positive regulatory protein
MSARQPARVRRAKLLRPHVGGGVVPRPRLLARLNDGLDKPLTLVSGPAGCGKTTLLCDWLATVAAPAAWLSLDDGDDDLASFVEHMVAALQTAVPGVGRSTLGLLRLADAPSAAEAATELGDELLALPDDVILVLDDYHAVDDSQVDDFLAALLRHPPPRLRLVLASRVDPFLPLAQLRAHGMLAEVRAADLRFTDDETRALLRAATDREPEADLVDLLQARTEGWVAGVRLAALALRDGGDRPALAGAASSMAAFLDAEVVAGQPDDVRRFLLRTAVPERLCADLCAALLDPAPAPAAAQRMLERLERAGLFVIPLGEDRRWYRYHHLFRDLLLRRLVGSEGEAELRRLHGRAGAWLADHGLVEEAIPHALAAGDPAAAADIVGRHVQRALAERRWPAVERWLGLLPPEQVQGRVDLLLARAWVQRIRGQGDAFASTLDRVDALLDRPDGTADHAALERWRTEATFLRRVFLGGYDASTRATLAAATRAAEAIPWETHAAGSAALVYAGTFRQLVGDQAGAVRALTRALAECAGRSDPFALHRAQCAGLGLMGVWLVAGELARRRRTAEELLALATAHGLGWGAGNARALLGTVAYEQGDLEAAIGHFSAGADEPEATSLMLSRLFLGLALAQGMAGRRADADATVNRYLDRLLAADNAAAIPAVRSFQARLAVARGELGPALRWLRASAVPGPAGSVHDFEIPLLTRARVLLADGSAAGLAEADAALDTPLRHAEAVHSVQLRIASLAHMALVQQARGRPDAALATITAALALAEPRGFFRTFVDLGAPMATLLGRCIRQTGASPLAIRVIAAIQAPPAAGATMPLPDVRVAGAAPRSGRARTFGACGCGSASGPRRPSRPGRRWRACRARAPGRAPPAPARRARRGCNSSGSSPSRGCSPRRRRIGRWRRGSRSATAASTGWPTRRRPPDRAASWQRGGDGSRASPSPAGRRCR